MSSAWTQAKYFHHGCALDEQGNQIASKRIEQRESLLKAFYEKYLSQSSVLVVVDQPNYIGRLTVSVVEATGCTVSYLPGLTMRQMSYAYPSNAKTDVRDSFIIANTALRMPDSLRPVDRVDEPYGRLKVLNGIDEDLTRAYTRMINQIRSALVGTFPEFERVLRGQIIHRTWVLKLLAKYGGPTKIRRLGKARATDSAYRNGAKKPQPVIDATFAAFTAQTVVIKGCKEAELGVKLYAADCLTKLEHRKLFAIQVEEIAAQIPEAELLQSMPGVSRKPQQQSRWRIGNFRDLSSIEELASCPVLRQRTNQSETFVNSNKANHSRNRIVSALFSAIRFHKHPHQFHEG